MKIYPTMVMGVKKTAKKGRNSWINEHKSSQMGGKSIQEQG
jgi:hypothetical protein